MNSVRRMVAIAVFGIAVIASPFVASAVQPDEVLADQALEKRARELSSELRCVVCQNQTIDDSDAPLARDLRLLVRERLVAGDTDGQVIDFLVARYGEFVLLQPRFAAHTVILWLLPFLILGFAVSFLFKRHRRELSSGLSGVPDGGLSQGETARLDALLTGDMTPPVSKE